MRTSHSDKRLIVITGGDPRGIGPEVILKSLPELSREKNIEFVIIGDLALFKRHKDSRFMSMCNFIDVPGACGISEKLSGQAAMDYLNLALSLLQKNPGASLVTAPISKIAINKAGYRFDGHTEFLIHATKSPRATMMLVGDKLRVSLVTRHLPLKRVPSSLSKRAVVDTTRDTYRALKNYFRIKSPRIGIAALNPHCGEGGLHGTEERLIIAPAVKQLKKTLSGIVGPLSPDIVFHKAFTGQFDAVVSMYHDQALIPLKMIAFHSGVNLTIGLPFIRTSPDHGTARDIAGKGVANPSSMIEAIKLAARLSAC